MIFKPRAITAGGSSPIAVRFLHLERFVRWSCCVKLSRIALLWCLVGVGACTAPARDVREPVAAAVERRVADPVGLALPNALTSVKFAVIGDSGRGDEPQHQVAAQMVRLRDAFKYPFVLMLGDNIYEGPASAEDYRQKFEEPYRTLLADNVKFFAVLGNHDDPRQVSYPLFNMGGQRYYSFAPPEDILAKAATRVEFFAIDSTNLDRAQLRWLEERLAQSTAEWKICLLHHPLYTSGRYRRTAQGHRWALEPIFVRYGVQVVFSGHEHIYQRTTLQQGVQYFVSGGAGSLRLDDAVPAPYVARSFDQDYHFMLVEIEGDELHFQAVARSGRTIDAGTLYLDEEEGRRAASTFRQADTAVPR